MPTGAETTPSETSPPEPAATAPDAGTDRPAFTRQNRTTHIAALGLTKIADGLIDPKLVLAWLVGELGAPGTVVGALVPVREAGALLPQLALARMVQARRVRKGIWAAGSAVQGLAALAIAASAVLLDGAAAGWAIVACLAVLASARAACSASHKDLLARTVEKGRRGRIGGTAGTIGSVAVLGFAAALATGWLPREVPVIAGAIAVAGALWLAAAAVMARLDEPAAEPDGAGDLGDLAKPLRDDAEFRTYLGTRILLIATALAPPFLVMQSAGADAAALGNLGVLLLAGAAAAIASSYIWGRASDASSRRTLAGAGALAAATLGLAAGLGLATGGLGGTWAAAGAIFTAQIAYQGARAGRKTHLTDMDTGDDKPLYTALSNTLVGVMLLAGGAFGVLAEVAGPAWTLAALAAMAGLGAALALRLSEVQDE